MTNHLNVDVMQKAKQQKLSLVFARVEIAFSQTLYKMNGDRIESAVSAV